jgi:Sec-independent protein secretion pathway component TatC
MSNFRGAQNQAHPNKTSTLMLALILVLILNVSIQIWLLYTALNNALDKNTDIAFPAFMASLVLFLIGAAWLYFLPSKIPPRKH